MSQLLHRLRQHKALFYLPIPMLCVYKASELWSLDATAKVLWMGTIVPVQAAFWNLIALVWMFLIAIAMDVFCGFYTKLIVPKIILGLMIIGTILFLFLAVLSL
jgi:hypothetical protein